MKKCPQCDMKLSFWHFKCPVCNQYVWRAHYIILIVIFLIGFWLVVDSYMSTEKIEKKKQKDIILPGSRVN